LVSKLRILSSKWFLLLISRFTARFWRASAAYINLSDRNPWFNILRRSPFLYNVLWFLLLSRWTHNFSRPRISSILM